LFSGYSGEGRSGLRTVLLCAVATILVLALRNTANAQNVGNAQLTFFATDNLGYLEFMDLANQSGDMILTQGQSILLNASQPYIILFVPYNADTQFESWSVGGDAILTPGDYMTNITVYTNTTLVAIASNPAMPTPEFPFGSLVVLILALAALIGVLDGRQAQISSTACRPNPQGRPRLR
jgi:hypothetical protein